MTKLLFSLHSSTAVWPEAWTHHTFYVPTSPSLPYIIIIHEVLLLLPLYTIFQRDRGLTSATQFRPYVPSARRTALRWSRISLLTHPASGRCGFLGQQRPAGSISDLSRMPCNQTLSGSMLPVLPLPLPCANRCPFSVDHPILFRHMCHCEGFSCAARLSPPRQ